MVVAMISSISSQYRQLAFGVRSRLTNEEISIKFFVLDHKTASLAKGLSPVKTKSKLSRCHKQKDSIIIAGILRWIRQQDAVLVSWFKKP
jgi:hypothetical protein